MYHIFYIILETMDLNNYSKISISWPFSLFGKIKIYCSAGSGPCGVFFDSKNFKTFQIFGISVILFVIMKILYFVLFVRCANGRSNKEGRDLREINRELKRIHTLLSDYGVSLMPKCANFYGLTLFNTTLDYLKNIL